MKTLQNCLTQRDVLDWMLDALEARRQQMVNGSNVMYDQALSRMSEITYAAGYAAAREDAAALVKTLWPEADELCDAIRAMATKERD